MDRSRPHRLHERAQRALREGRPAAALECYLELSRLAPEEGVWAERVADLYRRLGRRREAADALECAAERYAAAGDLPRALAACRLLRSLDPRPRPVLRRLGPMPSSRGEAGLRSPARVPEGAPLDEIVLTEVLDGPPDGQPGLPAGSSEVLLDARPVAAQGVVPLAREVVRASSAGERGAAAIAAVRRVADLSPLVSVLDEEGRRILTEGVEVVDVPADEVVLRQGDSGDRLYVVVEGAVVPIAEGVPPKRLGCLEEGEIFGEIAVVTDQPRTATVETLVPTRLLSLDRRLVQRLVRHEPRVLRVLLRLLRERLVERLVATSPLFDGMEPNRARALAGRFRLVESSEGSSLVEQGRPSPGLFVVVAGEAEVVLFDGSCNRTLARLRPGDCFGEMSLLRDRDATASVVAPCRSWLLLLPAEALLRALDEEPELRRALARLAEQRERRNDELFGTGDVVDYSLDLV